MPTSFFDFHCHPGLKPLFADENNRPTPWDKLRISIKIAGFDIGVNELFNEVLNSQSCLSQLVNPNARLNLIGLVLHAPESHMGKSLLERNIIQKDKIKLINKKSITAIAAGTNYYSSINTELQGLVSSTAPNFLPRASLKIINSINEFVPTDTDTVHGVLIVEGLHCFMCSDVPEDTPQARSDFNKNFDEFTAAHRLLAINVCHIQQNPFCNHASGIQFFNDKYFYPVQSGISAWGKEVITKMYQKKILADVKHMSLLSRMQLTILRNELLATMPDMPPLICTHAGVTGISMNDRLKYLMEKPVLQPGGSVYLNVYYKKRGHVTGTYFNHSSLNLYDEDIVRILDSGGLIGLSFDQRILGFPNDSVLLDFVTPADAEFVSVNEAKTFYQTNKPERLPTWKNFEEMATEESFQDELLLDRYFLHLDYFLNQYFHILWVADQNGLMEQAKKGVCLGTDYDGLINAIDCCKFADGLDGMYANLKKRFTSYFLQKTTGLKMTEPEIAVCIDGLFFNNAKAFLDKWFV